MKNVLDISPITCNPRIVLLTRGVFRRRSADGAGCGACGRGDNVSPALGRPWGPARPVLRPDREELADGGAVARFPRLSCPRGGCGKPRDPPIAPRSAARGRKENAAVERREAGALS